MIPWGVCLATLVFACWTDVRTRAIPMWLPVVPVVALAWAWSPTTLGWGAVLSGLALLAGAVGACWAADVGLGDVALLIPLVFVLGPWVTVLLAVSLSTGAVVMRRTGRSDGPFVPHVLAGFLVASGVRWALGGS